MGFTDEDTFDKMFQSQEGL